MFTLNNGNFASLLKRHDYKYSVETMMAHHEAAEPHDWDCAGFYVQKINKLGAMSCSSVNYRHDNEASERQFGHIPTEDQGRVNAYITGASTLYVGPGDIKDFLTLHETNPHPVRGFVTTTPLSGYNSLFLRVQNDDLSGIDTGELARLDTYQDFPSLLEGLGRAGINTYVSGPLALNSRMPEEIFNDRRLFPEI